MGILSNGRKPRRKSDAEAVLVKHLSVGDLDGFLPTAYRVAYGVRHGECVDDDAISSGVHEMGDMERTPTSRRREDVGEIEGYLKELYCMCISLCLYYLCTPLLYDVEMEDEIIQEAGEDTAR